MFKPLRFDFFLPKLNVPIFFRVYSQFDCDSHTHQDSEVTYSDV